MSLLLTSLKSSYNFISKFYLLFIALILVDLFLAAVSYSTQGFADEKSGSICSMFDLIVTLYLVYQYKIYCDKEEVGFLTKIKEVIKRLFVLPATIFFMLIALLIISFLGSIPLFVTGLVQLSDGFTEVISKISLPENLIIVISISTFWIMLLSLFSYLTISSTGAFLQKDYFYIKSFIKVAKNLRFKEFLSYYLFTFLSLAVIFVYTAAELFAMLNSETIKLIIAGNYYTFLIALMLLQIPLLAFGYFFTIVHAAFAYTVIKRQ
jgi:hypothetical protein